MIEREIKILEINPKKVFKKFKKMGAKKTFEGHIIDHYFDLPVGEKKVRIRLLENGETIFGIKEKIFESKNIKSAHEYEKNISRKDAFDLTKKLGLSHSRSKCKKRISYKIGTTSFDMDFYPNIPPILEIESQNEKDFDKWIKKLKLDNYKIKTFGAKKLHKYYQTSLPEFSL